MLSQNDSVQIFNRTGGFILLIGSAPHFVKKNEYRNTPRCFFFKYLSGKTLEGGGDNFGECFSNYYTGYQVTFSQSEGTPSSSHFVGGE